MIGELSRIARMLDLKGFHHVADEMDRVIMSAEGGYFPPPPPKKINSPQEEPQQDELGVVTGEPPLDDDPKNVIIDNIKTPPKKTIGKPKSLKNRIV